MRQSIAQYKSEALALAHRKVSTRGLILSLKSHWGTQYEHVRPCNERQRPRAKLVCPRHRASVAESDSKTQLHLDGVPQAADQSYNMAATLVDGHKIGQPD